MILEWFGFLPGRCVASACISEPHIVGRLLRTENLGDTVTAVVVVDEGISAVTIREVVGVLGVKGTDGHHCGA